MSNSRLAGSILLAALCLMALAWAADAALTRAVSDNESLVAGRLPRLDDPRHVAEDIPIFGASKAGSNYVPAVLGPRFYNYGMEAVSPDLTNMLMTTMLRHPSHQPVVIDLGQWMLQGVGDPRNYLPLTNRPEVRAAMDRAGVWRWYHGVPGLRYFGAWDWYVKGLLSDRLALTRRIDRGYEIDLGEVPWSADVFGRDVARRREITLTWDLDPRQRVRLMELIASAPQRQFVLVLSPLHHSCLDKTSGEAAFREVLRQMKLAAPNLRIIDMTRRDYPDTYFLNTVHLNQRGARVFSAQLHAELVRLKVLSG